MGQVELCMYEYVCWVFIYLYIFLGQAPSKLADSSATKNIKGKLPFPHYIDLGFEVIEVPT